MQLVPQLSTISRPVFQDRLGYLYTTVPCTQCEDGQYEDINPDPNGRSIWRTCDCCNGTCEVYEEIEKLNEEEK